MAAGYVAAVSVDLHLPMSGSLKDKRREVKRLTAGLMRTFGCAAAEVDHHDLRQRAAVTAALVSGDPKELGARVEAVSRWLHSDELFEVLAEDRAIMKVNDDDQGWDL